MVDVVTDYSKESLVNAIHDSWNYIMNLIMQNPLATLIKKPQLTGFISNLNIATFNRIVYTDLRPSDTEVMIKEMIDLFSSKQLPFTWQVDPRSKPDDLADRLEKAGLERDDGTGMAAILEDLKEPTIPSEFSYKMVDTVEENREFIRLMCKASGLPEESFELFYTQFETQGLREDYQHYIGYFDGDSVSTSSILYGEGVAGLYNVATLPEVRGKRIGSVISYVPFIDAKKRGYKIVILHSTKMGYNVYRRLGFEEICKLIRCIWKPET